MSEGSPSVALLKRYNFYLIDFGWLVGLVYYFWIHSSPPYFGVVKICLLLTVGTVIVSSLIGATTSTIAGAITYKVTGDFEGATDYFSLMLFGAPFFGFLAAKYSLKLLA